MLANNIRHEILVRLPSSLPVFDAKRQPPELNQHALLMKIAHHALDGISGKSFLARLPVPIIVEPPVVQRRPFDTHFFQLRNRSQHLRGSNIEFISPATPTGVVSFTRRLCKFPSLLL